jgi:hypothetical protein
MNINGNFTLGKRTSLDGRLDGPRNHPNVAVRRITPASVSEVNFGHSVPASKVIKYNKVLEAALWAPNNMGRT